MPTYRNIANDSENEDVTTLANTDRIPVIQDAAPDALKEITYSNLNTQLLTHPRIADITERQMWNGRLSVTVSASDLIVAIKTDAGTNPTASDPVYVKIGGNLRTISAALSITCADATNWFAAGSSELATKEIDYFAYIGYNATDGVVLGASRIPYARQYSNFSTTSTNELYARISTITTAASTDPYVNIGRFAATLSAGAGYTWTVPTFTPSNLIQYPIYESEWKDWTPTIAVGYSAAPTDTVYKYRIDGKIVYLIMREATSGTSNTTSNSTYTLPFTAATLTNMSWIASTSAFDNGTLQATGTGTVASAGSTISMLKSAAAAWTASGGRRQSLIEGFSYLIAT